MRDILPKSIPVLLTLTTLVLAGCDTSRDFSDLRAEMSRLDERPSGQVPDVPEYESQELFFYTAADLRSPFRSFIVEAEEEEEEPEDTGVEPPDEDREPDPLEAYSLDNLRMVGHLQREGESIRGLVVTPDGTLHQIRAGQYMGQNFGRVMSITPRRIEIRETVPSGRGGWLERPQTISLAE